VEKEHKEKVAEKVKALIEFAKTNGTKVDWSKEKPIETSLSKVIKTQEQADFFMLCLRALIEPKNATIPTDIVCSCEQPIRNKVNGNCNLCNKLWRLNDL